MLYRSIAGFVCLVTVAGCGGDDNEVINTPTTVEAVSGQNAVGFANARLDDPEGNQLTVFQELD